MFRIKPRGTRIVTIEIVTIDPIMLGHCEHCEILMKGFGIDYKPQQVSEYPEEVLELSTRITRFINTITSRIFARVVIVEALTLRGFIKMIVYRSGKLPIIAVNGRRIVAGSNWEPETLARKVLAMLPSG